MEDDVRFAQIRVLAQAILSRLGDAAPGWTVLDVGWADDPTWQSADAAVALDSWYTGEPEPLPQPPPHAMLAVLLGPPAADQRDTVTAHDPTQVPAAEAVAELASQIQDHASTASWGRALPPCPGHTHPLSAHLVDGVAMWECPQASGHHREPIG